jgi:hypothetical protein
MYQCSPVVETTTATTNPMTVTDSTTVVPTTVTTSIQMSTTTTSTTSIPTTESTTQGTTAVTNGPTPIPFTTTTTSQVTTGARFDTRKYLNPESLNISANIMAIIMSLQGHQNVRTDWLDATCGWTMASAKTVPI